MRRIVPAPGGSIAGWILPAAAGSVHIVSADGELVVRFNYGQAVTGMSFAHDEGRQLLNVSSPEGMVAWWLDSVNAAPEGEPAAD